MAAFSDRRFEFVVERNSPSYISAWVAYSNRPDKTVPSATVRLVNVKSPSENILLFDSGFSRSNTSGSSGKGTVLNDGVEVQAEVTVGDKKQFSPIFKP